MIAGHTVHTDGRAFDDLEDLRRGNAIRLATRNGDIDYTVTRVAIYSKASLASHAQQLFSQSVKGRLALVTC